MTNEQKEELIKLGIDPMTGRKHRSDAGKVRGPNSKTRCDAGISRIGTVNTQNRDKLAVYLTIKKKVLSNTDTDKSVIDNNGMYITVNRENKKIKDFHQAVVHGQAYQRQYRYIQGYEVDLEQYRFEALQEKALIAPSDNIPDKYLNNGLTREINDTHANTWFELFTSLYHIAQEEVHKWTYKHWRKDYNILVSADFSFSLYPSFQFNYSYHPGSVDFMPELSDTYQSLYQQRIDEIKNSREYQLKLARAIDECAAPYRKDVEVQVYYAPENADKSVAELDKLVRDEVAHTYKNIIDSEVDQIMSDYIKERLEDE